MTVCINKLIYNQNLIKSKNILEICRLNKYDCIKIANKYFEINIYCIIQTIIIFYPYILCRLNSTGYNINTF